MAMRTQTRETARPEAREGAILRPEAVEGYLQALAARGRGSETVRLYGAKLRALYQYLPEDKRITRETLGQWQETLLESGYSPGTVNTHLSAANGLLDYMGRRDLQVSGRLDPDTQPQPELTRGEYLRLLQAAKVLGRERTYLLVKVFALTGLRIGELPQMTVEAAEAGRLTASGDRQAGGLPLPACLRRELLDYARRKSVRSGPVFVTRSGRPVRRTQVTGEIRAMCRDARVEERKGSPRCLRRLCQSTLEDIERDVRRLAEQSYERLLEAEQLSAGWETDGAVL